MPDTDIDNLDHDPALAQALGNMVVAWAKAETALVHLYAYAMNHNYDMAMAAYYRIPNFETRTKMIAASLVHWETRDYDVAAIKTAVAKLVKLARTRNKWIHGTYGLKDGSDKTILYDARAEPGTPEHRKRIKDADVLNHISAVRRRTRDLEKLVQIEIRLSVRLSSR